MSANHIAIAQPAAGSVKRSLAMGRSAVVKGSDTDRDTRRVAASSPQDLAMGFNARDNRSEMEKTAAMEFSHVDRIRKPKRT